MSTETKPKNFITGEVRLSYPHLFEPSAIDEKKPDEKKYSAKFLIDKSDKATIDGIKAELDRIYESEKNGKFKGKVRSKLKMPLRDGDEEFPDREEYKGKYFINANSTRKPGVVYKQGKETHPILNVDDVYAGMYVRASVNFYAFDKAGNVGIACGLQNVLKVRDGERLAGGASAEEDFADIEAAEGDGGIFD
jgi:hypothetical protein